MTMSNESSAAKLRVVVDTSVYIAAILRPGLSEDVLRLIYEGYADLYCSKDILNELTSRLAEKPFNVDSTRVKIALSRILFVAKFVEPKLVEESRLRDQSDLFIINCAVAACADLIVTLDRDLLSLKESHGIGIIHPKSFRWIATEVLSDASNIGTGKLL